MYAKLLICCLSVCLVFPFFGIARAEEDTSGWAQCDLQSADYHQARCIVKAAQYKGARAPYDFAINEGEALALWHWATERPRPLSACTAAGVGGELLPENVKALCPDYTPPPAPDPVVVIWLPIVGNCLYGDADWQACGR